MSRPNLLRVLAALPLLLTAAGVTHAQEPATATAPDPRVEAALKGAQLGFLIDEGDYRLDPDHAALLFEVDHMGFSKFVGRFDAIDATLTFDPAAPEAARLTIEGLKRRRFEISYPWRFVLIMMLARLMPYGLFFRLIKRTVLKA